MRHLKRLNTFIPILAMTKEQMIDKIYEAIWETFNANYFWWDPVSHDYTSWYLKWLEDIWYKRNLWKKPVMIGDVMDWYWIPYDILEHWDELKKPIEDQSDECITFIYNLFND